MRELRRLHIALSGGVVVPVVATHEDVQGLLAIRRALPNACASLSQAIDARTTERKVDNACTLRCDGYRLSYWLQRTEATFAVVVRGSSYTPTRQTLFIVAERDAAAPVLIE